MKNKILGIFISTLVLLMIPIVAGATGNEDPQSPQIGWTTLQGFIYGLNEINNGAILEFKCLFVHYVGQGLGQRKTGFRFGGQMMVIPGSFRGVLLPRLILGWCPGVLEF